MPDPHPAVAAIQRFYAAEAAYLRPGGGDFAALAATLDPDCVLYQPASLPYGGEWRGPRGFERWLRAFGEAWSSLEVRDSEFYPVGNMVFSRSHVDAVARATGQPADWLLLQFFRVRDGCATPASSNCVPSTGTRPPCCPPGSHPGGHRCGREHGSRKA